ncbi:hypothetical protein RHSIM_Rhsim11G0117100 [Rhododendron simsii]|uniref:NAC domain-containing protein n=1 Tax=Rhododendron simsii TaxID=118357 RepID=A0A834LBZ3_RHOSS|nr:hypothetical protein RHSIM_Rhsim11G0117100 [Rhododendron simsii]
MGPETKLHGIFSPRMIRGKKEEGSVYVLTKLIKASGSDKRTARTAGCCSWHGETGPARILDKKHRVIGNNQSPKGSEYVLCRIKKKRYDSKDTNKSPKRVKNVEVPKPAKRARTEKFEQEQTVEARETENTVPYSLELLEAEKEGHYSQMLSDVDVDLEELHPMLESEQLARIGLDFDASDSRTLSWLPPTLFLEEFSGVEEQGNYSQMLFDMDADLDFDALDPQALYGLAQTPFSEELSEAEKQGNYSQMLSSMSDADLMRS